MFKYIHGAFVSTEKAYTNVCLAVDLPSANYHSRTEANASFIGNFEGRYVNNYFVSTLHLT